jgi:ABC-type transport system involved in multi-copper enzyme maturation permease subunit
MTNAPARSQPSFLTASFRIFDLSLGQMLWSRRSVFLAIMVVGPILLATILHLVTSLEPGNVPRVNGARISGATIFGFMIWWLYIYVIVPVLGVFYGTSLIADEIDDKTITYLFVRPIPRGAVLVGKYLSYLVCTTLLILPSVSRPASSAWRSFAGWRCGWQDGPSRRGNMCSSNK